MANLEQRWRCTRSGRAIGHELFFRTLDNHIMVAGYTVKGDSVRGRQTASVVEKQLADVGIGAATTILRRTASASLR